ncbi:MAG: methyltransferase domain-containing protein [Actinomycetota bacterium]|nr:methyltransferase domain-containing protein [Actinomycetota bacterium]
MRPSHNNPVPPPSLVGSEASQAAALPGWRPPRTRRRGVSPLAWRRSKSWDDHVAHVEELTDTPGFVRLRQEILALAQLTPEDRVVDIGAGTGLLALAAAPEVRHVSAIDISPAMCRRLEAKVAGLAHTNVDVLVANATVLPLADGSADVVLSNYCFHHVSDKDKRRALEEITRVLRPGGRLVIGDMMFEVGLRGTRERALILRFVRSMLRRGPAGLLRLLKNAVRLASGRGEHPASVDWWRRALSDAGFAAAEVWPLDHEGGIAVARRT